MRALYARRSWWERRVVHLENWTKRRMGSEGASERARSPACLTHRVNPFQSSPFLIWGPAAAALALAARVAYDAQSRQDQVSQATQLAQESKWES